MENNNFALKTVLILFLVMIIAGVFLYLRQTPSKREIYRTSFQEGADLQAKGDKRAVYKFEEALRNATTVEEEAVAKLNVATAYVWSDPIKSMQMLKEIYANTVYPPRIRAATIDYMVQWYSGTFDLDLVKDHVLTGGQPWESFFDGNKDEFTKKDATLALRKAEEHATTIYSFFTSEYVIAYGYSAYELLENASNENEVAKYTEIILDRIRRGDIAYDQSIYSGAKVRDSQYGWGFFYKAFALTNLYSVGTYKDTSEIEESYEMAISYQEKVPRIGTAINPRLNYMLFLARLNTDAADAKIRDQISALYAKGLDSDPKLTQSVANLVQDERYNRQFDKLASLDPRFKDLIVSLGWK